MLEVMDMISHLVQIGRHICNMNHVITMVKGQMYLTIMITSYEYRVVNIALHVDLVLHSRQIVFQVCDANDYCSN